MERHGHLQLAPKVRTRLLGMSAATMDRALRPVRAQAGGTTRRRTAPLAHLFGADWRRAHLGLMGAKRAWATRTDWEQTCAEQT